MTFKYLLCVLLFFTIRGISFSQDRIITNLEAVNNLLEESFVPLENEFLINGKDVFYNIIENGEEGNFILNSLKSRFNEYSFLRNYDGAQDSEKIILNVSLINPVIKTKYVRIFTDDIIGSKFVERKVNVRYEILILNPSDSSVVYRTKFDKTSKDKFELDDIGLMEDRRFSFTAAVVPEESTFDSILIPAAVIIASAVAVILFFTIRSR